MHVQCLLFADHNTRFVVELLPSSSSTTTTSSMLCSLLVVVVVVRDRQTLLESPSPPNQTNTPASLDALGATANAFGDRTLTDNNNNKINKNNNNNNNNNNSNNKRRKQRAERSRGTACATAYMRAHTRACMRARARVSE